MSGPFRPMLAATVEDTRSLAFPLLASLKVDGIRATFHKGVAMSRSMKPIPNRYLQEWAQCYASFLEGVDGELVVGMPNSPTVCVDTRSALMRVEGMPEFRLLAFDVFDMTCDYYSIRLEDLGKRVRRVPRVHIWTSVPITDAEGLRALEEQAISMGYEGLILRAELSPYKQGRSTLREARLLKLKRFHDAEAWVVDVEEEMHNGNPAEVSPTGGTVHSHHKAGLVGKGTLGALVVRGIGYFEGVEFRIGSGFTAEQRRLLWKQRASLVGQVATYRHFLGGAQDAPRFPTFHVWRDPVDMD